MKNHKIFPYHHTYVQILDISLSHTQDYTSLIKKLTKIILEKSHGRRQKEEDVKINEMCDCRVCAYMRLSCVTCPYVILETSRCATASVIWAAVTEGKLLNTYNERDNLKIQGIEDVQNARIRQDADKRSTCTGDTKARKKRARSRLTPRYNCGQRGRCWDPRRPYRFSGHRRPWRERVPDV